MSRQPHHRPAGGPVDERRDLYATRLQVEVSEHVAELLRVDDAVKADQHGILREAPHRHLAGRKPAHGRARRKLATIRDCRDDLLTLLPIRPRHPGVVVDDQGIARGVQRLPRPDRLDRPAVRAGHLRRRVEAGGPQQLRGGGEAIVADPGFHGQLPGRTALRAALPARRGASSNSAAAPVQQDHAEGVQLPRPPQIRTWVTACGGAGDRQSVPVAPVVRVEPCRFLHRRDGCRRTAGVEIAVREHLVGLRMRRHGRARHARVRARLAAVARVQGGHGVVERRIGDHGAYGGDANEDACPRDGESEAQARDQPCLGAGPERRPRQAQTGECEQAEAHGGNLPVPVDARVDGPHQERCEQRAVDRTPNAAGPHRKPDEDRTEGDHEQHEPDDPELPEDLEVERVRLAGLARDRPEAQPLGLERARARTGKAVRAEVLERDLPVVLAAAQRDLAEAGPRVARSDSRRLGVGERVVRLLHTAGRVQRHRQPTRQHGGDDCPD